MDILRNRKPPTILLSSILLPIFLSAAPAYATDKNILEADTTFVQSLKNSQTLTVNPEAKIPSITRDAITVTSAPIAVVNKTPNNYAGEQKYNGGSIVEYARQFIGIVPYVANSSNPNVGFDCSGFTKYVFANTLGISLPHSSTAQGEMGTPISASQAQPGDLLVWHGHVAIYTGGGMMIDAAVPGTYISEKPIWGNPTYIRL